MKKTIMPLFVLLLSISFVSATIDVEFACSDSSCTEGTSMNWTITVLNNINRTIAVGDIMVKDINTNQLIAFHNSEGIVLGPQELHVFEFSNLVPAPMAGGYTFLFVPCFQVIVENETADICRDTMKSLTVLPLSKIECFADSDCSFMEYYNKDIMKCKPLECEKGQVITEHQCLNLKCAWFENNDGGACSYNPAVSIVAIIIAIIVITTIYANKGKRKPKKRSKKKK